MPEGPIKVDDHKIVPPPRAEMKVMYYFFMSLCVMYCTSCFFLYLLFGSPALCDVSGVACLCRAFVFRLGKFCADVHVKLSSAGQCSIVMYQNIFLIHAHVLLRVSRSPWRL